MIRLVSWDLDGTLYARGPMLRRMLWHASISELRAFKAYHLALEAQRASSVVDLTALARYEAARSREHTLLLSILARIGPSKRALRRIAAYTEAGVIQVVLSDFPAREKLIALGLDRRFAEVYACEELGHWKPAAEPFAFIQRIHGVRPDEHLHIGDRADTDGEGARRSKCHFELF